jgi:signal transduction histidine kinase/integral membrane sensor domain MASE1
VTFPNLVSSARDLRGGRHAAIVVLLLALSVVVAVASSGLLQTSLNVFSWWPASGLNVIAAVTVRKRYRWIVLVAIAASTAPVALVGGRPLIVAVVSAIAVAAEAWIVTRFCVDDDDQPRLTTPRDVIRFFIGVLLGSSVTAIVAGSTIAIALGSDLPTIAFSLFASHASAIAVLAPIALVNRLKKPMGRRSLRAGHAALLALASFIAFAPGGVASLSFLPVPFLAWAAFSFSMSFALLELIGSSVLIVALTAAGGGPFTATEQFSLPPAALLEFYVVTLSVTTLLIAAARNERQQLVEENGAIARMLHEGFRLSANGFAIVTKDDGHYRVIEVNPAARQLLDGVFAADRVVAGSVLGELLDELLAGDGEELTITRDAPDTIPCTVTATRARNATFGAILLISITDLRPIRAAQESVKHQLVQEQRVVEELRALNEHKDAFVSSVTHELRTPITTVIGFSEELADTDLDPVQRDYVTIVIRNAQRLLRTIEDVLTFSRRMPRSAPSDVEVSDLVVAVLEDLRHSFRNRNISVSTRLPREPVHVVAELNDLTRVLINLVTNAVKFTPQDGRIDVAVETDGADVIIAITDSGPGIAPAELERVFERFYRSSSASRSDVPGTGLGLAIVRDLVTEMHGRVVLESDGQSGTTARVTLPAAIRN